VLEWGFDMTFELILDLTCIFVNHHQLSFH
jgi:hypothetical protein